MLIEHKNHTSVVKGGLARLANQPLLMFLGMALLCIAFPSHAADFDLPSVSIPGVTSSSSATEIIVAVLKYAVKMVLWILVLIVGVGFIKNTVKSVHKVRRDEEGKWADVIGEITGNAVVVICAILLASWVSGLLN